MFESPEMLQVVDRRSSLLSICWVLHTAGVERSVPDLLTRFRESTTNEVVAPRAPLRTDRI